MSEPEKQATQANNDEEPQSGPNLYLLYSLVAIALAAAIGIAMLIVLPYYQRR